MATPVCYKHLRECRLSHFLNSTRKPELSWSPEAKKKAFPKLSYSYNISMHSVSQILITVGKPAADSGPSQLEISLESITWPVFEATSSKHSDAIILVAPRQSRQVHDLIMAALAPCSWNLVVSCLTNENSDMHYQGGGIQCKSRTSYATTRHRLGASTTSR